MSDSTDGDNEQCPRCGNELNELAPSPFGSHDGPMRYECLDCQKVWTKTELEDERDA